MLHMLDGSGLPYYIWVSHFPTLLGLLTWAILRHVVGRHHDDIHIHYWD